MRENTELNLALLIDADNISHSYISEMLEEIAKFGTPTIKRIYGDWTRPSASNWKKVLLEHAITPVQQYSYTKGKNATDSAMIIDAMDILHNEQVDGFCLASSDSDFTKLATRLRESGKTVIGIGEKKTPNPFIVACNKFIYLEIISRKEKDSEPKKKSNSKQEPDPGLEAIDAKFIQILRNSVNDLADDDGWAQLGEVGSLLIKKRPDFDPRNYGFSKLTPLIKSLKKHFAVDARESGKKHIKHIYIKCKY